MTDPGEGFASRVSGTVRLQDPGGGATPVAAPRRIKTDDVSDTADLFGGGGGGAPVIPRMSVVLVEETNAGTLHVRRVHVTIKRGSHATAGTNRPLGGTVSEGDTRSPCGGGGGGVLPPSLSAGRLLPVDVTNAPTLSVEGPRSVPSRISVVLVDGTIAGDAPGRECPREDGILRTRAGETRPAGVSVGGGDA